MVTAQKNFRHRLTFVNLGPGVVRTIQQSVGKGILLRRLRMTQRSGDEACNRIDNSHRCQFATGQHKIAQ